LRVASAAWWASTMSAIIVSRRSRDGPSSARSHADGRACPEHWRFTIYFGQVGPKVCNMRVDYGKTRPWVEFDQK
jgi:hypothetical protein